jgi:hypothetical protein
LLLSRCTANIVLQPFGIFLGMAGVLILQEALSPAAMMLFGLLTPTCCSRAVLQTLFGIFLGMAVVLTLQEALSSAAMMLFGWRIAFLLGAPTGVVGVMLR